MPDRQPEPWESDAAGPFLSIDTEQRAVQVWALGDDHFAVRAPGHERIVIGLEEAQQAAHALAERLRQWDERAQRLAWCIQHEEMTIQDRAARK